MFADACVVDRAFAQIGEVRPPHLVMTDLGALTVGDVPLGEPTAAGAAAQVAYLDAAMEVANDGRIHGLVTAPISKQQIASVGFGFPGHTEYLAARLGAERVAMMFVGPKLTVVLATIHIPLAAVPESLTRQAIIDATELAVMTMRERLGVARPRVGIVGLNPHAGEAGILGREEIETISPAVDDCRERMAALADISGPIVPDAAFRQALEGDYDVLVAMYHDQGLIPIKVVDFENSVNCTVGLPIVRTSPDHGVAYDIAGQNRARADSFGAALRLAIRMVDNASE